MGSVMSTPTLEKTSTSTIAMGVRPLIAALRNRLFSCAGKWLVRFAIGTSALVYIVYFIGVHEVWRRIENVNSVALFGALALMALQNVIFAVRWRSLALCTKGLLPLTQAIIGNFELAFVSQIAPTALAGDAVRIIRAQRAGLTLDQGVSSVMLDRMIGLAVVVFLTPLLFFIASNGPVDQRLSFAIMLFAGIFAAGLPALYFVKPVAAIFDKYRLVRLLISVSEAFRAMLGSPLTAATAFAASLLGYVLAAATLASLAAAIAVPVSVLMALPVVCTMTLASFLPVSIGGWGVREGAALVSLHVFSIPAHQAVALSVLYGLVGAAIGVSGGIVWIIAGYRRPRRSRPATLS